ncbi:MAG: hypothetical protein ABIU87_12115 [Ornithinibacter sp.]
MRERTHPAASPQVADPQVPNSIPADQRQELRLDTGERPIGGDAPPCGGVAAPEVGEGANGAGRSLAHPLLMAGDDGAGVPAERVRLFHSERKRETDALGGHSRRLPSGHLVSLPSG